MVEKRRTQNVLALSYFTPLVCFLANIFISNGRVLRVLRRLRKLYIYCKYMYILYIHGVKTC